MSGAFEGKSLTPSVHCLTVCRLKTPKRGCCILSGMHCSVSSVLFFRCSYRAAATDWFDQLSDRVRRNFDQLEASFLARFTSSDFTRWVRVTDMFSGIKSPSESVDEYVVQIQKMAKAVEMKDDNFIRYAILKGLKPHIRCYVLQNNAKTVDEVLRLGRIVEQTVANDVSLLSELQKDRNVAQPEAELKNWRQRCRS